MKKIFAVLLVFFMLIPLASCDILDEYISPYDMRLSYDGTYYILSGVNKDLSGEITLPETYKGLPVKEIGIWGFCANDGRGSTSEVTKVIIPDCYEKIGASAFHDKPNLREVIIGNSVKEIGPGAFEGCTSLESVTFGSSLEAIYAEAFQYCEKLDNVVLPDTLKEITYRAFAYCSSLKTIVIPRSVEKMLTDVFYENDSLTDIYCEIEAQPESWNVEWCGNYRDYLQNNDVNVTFGYGSGNPTVSYCVSYKKYPPLDTEDLSYLYPAGSEVVFYIEPVDGADSLAMYINGVRHSVGTVIEGEHEGNSVTLWQYTFIMPEEHAHISFEIETESGK